MNEDPPKTLEEAAETILAKRRWATAMSYALGFGEVALQVNADHRAIVLPEHLKGVQLLKYGLNLAIPIPDLRIDATGVLGTLSFARTPYLTFIPWEAVMAIVLPDDMPQITVEDLDRLSLKAIVEIVHGPKAGARHLRLIRADETPPEGDAPVIPEDYTGPELVK